MSRTQLLPANDGQPEPILWRATQARIAACQLTQFSHLAQSRYGAPAMPADPALAQQTLHEWSVRESAQFWSAMLEFSHTLAERGAATLTNRHQMPGARWFEDTQLNYAENLLVGPDHEIVLIARDEAGRREQLTRGELRQAVLSVAAALHELGIGIGDVVAGFTVNNTDAVIAILATTWLGGVWTCTSPDFGTEAAVDRFSQVQAKLLLATTHYVYGGKIYDCEGKVRAISERVASLQHVVRFESAEWRAMRDTDLASPPLPRRLPFNAPLFVLYSSGTTGKPKAIVHGIGGTLLQHCKEHRLHTDIRPGDRVFFYTTCGWMMWNWLVSALASRATVVLFDGAPTHPDIGALWRMAAEEAVSVFGTSPRYLAALESAGYRPHDNHDLSALRTVLSTGAPLAASQFDFVYAAIAADVHLASISGGTDIISCFCLGSPWLPVRRGEIQAAGLGMAVDVFDEKGCSARNARGELVCHAPFPSMPLGFMHDPGAKRYAAAYFARFANVWHHGDYAVRTATGGFIILGRSDAVLNPGGVRIGTAEIYRQVERVPAVVESLAIGQKLARGDERIVLFVRLQPGRTLDAALEQEIRQVIRSNTTSRHVPERIIAVNDLPRTLNGKLAELAVRNVVHGEPVANREVLANPESLELFLDLPQLRDC